MAEQNQNSPQSSWEQEALQNTLLASITEQRRARRWGIFFKILVAIYFFGLLFVFWPKGKIEETQEHTAIIDIKGKIEANDETDGDSVAAALRRAFDNKHAKAIILRINSPGGSPVQASYIYNEIKRLRGLNPDKKVYAAIADLGGSAAYYIAAAADEIYADEASIVGSIGVLMPSFGLVEVMNKVGVEQRSLTAGDNKLMLDPFSPRNEKQEAFAQDLIKHVHQQFISAVKRGRGDRLKETPDMFSGLFWTGEQALALGLIDGLGSTGFVARDIIGVERTVDYTPAKNLLDKITNKMGTAMAKQLASSMGLEATTQLR